MDRLNKKLTRTQKSYIDMLERYENARAKGLRGNYFIKHTLVPETGQKYSSIDRAIKRGRELRNKI
ncbi:hypothetical protein [Nonlabens arenilitoris]|nr:hypothetical protein [Nonlabens arenilitoris]